MLFLQSNSLTITIVCQKYQDLLQSNSHDRSKISRTFYASRKSWIIVVFLLCTLKEKLLIFLINTLLLHIPLLALTHRQNYRETDRITERQIHLLRVGWRNIFPVVLLCQFFGCGGKSSGWYLPTIPVVPLCLFLLRREIVFGCTGRFFGCGRKKF